MIYINGDVYNGQWKDDMRNGIGIADLTLGVCEYSTGNRYEGQWKNDLCNKQGNAIKEL